MSTPMAPPNITLTTRGLQGPAPSVYENLHFAGCPELIGTLFSYAREEEIYGEDEEAEFVYKVIGGAVRTHKVLNDGRRQITGFHLPGEMLGLERHERHHDTAEALSDTRMLIFRRRQIERIATANADMACQLWGIAADRLHYAQNHMLLLGRRSALERVVSFLMELDARLGATGTFSLPMSRRDIADYLGLTIETVSRVITQLEDEGALLRVGGRQISLHRPHLHRLIAF